MAVLFKFYLCSSSRFFFQEQGFLFYKSHVFLAILHWRIRRERKRCWQKCYSLVLGAIKSDNLFIKFENIDKWKEGKICHDFTVKARPLLISWNINFRSLCKCKPFYGNCQTAHKLLLRFDISRNFPVVSIIFMNAILMAIVKERNTCHTC